MKAAVIICDNRYAQWHTEETELGQRNALYFTEIYVTGNIGLLQINIFIITSHHYGNNLKTRILDETL